MVDSDLILARAASVRSHLGRVFEKRKVDLDDFLKDYLIFKWPFKIVLTSQLILLVKRA